MNFFKVIILFLMFSTGCDIDGKRPSSPYDNPLYVDHNEVDLKVKITDREKGEGIITITNANTYKNNRTIKIQFLSSKDSNLGQVVYLYERREFHQFKANIDSVFIITVNSRTKVYKPLECLK